MTTTETDAEILKVDAHGRVRSTPERRQKLLEEFDKSGLSGPKFAALTGLKYQTFATWLQKRKRLQGSAEAAVPKLNAPAKAMQWLETVIEEAAPASASSAMALLVRLPSGAVVEVANSGQATLAAAVLRAWEKTPC
jgi:DNA-binding transcriptional regulator YiaG